MGFRSGSRVVSLTLAALLSAPGCVEAGDDPERVEVESTELRTDVREATTTTASP